MRKPAKLPLPAFSATILFLLMTVFFVLCTTRDLMQDPDIGWHLRNAQIMLQTHQVLRQDFYTFSLAGHSWMDPEWLSEIVFYGTWKLFGVRGVEVTSILLLEGLFAGVCLLARQRVRSLRPALVSPVLFVFLAGVSIGPRTQLFGWNCFVVLLALLNNYRSGRRSGAPLLWALPPLFALWINLHGSWPIGFVMLAVFIACGLKSFRIGNLESVAWTTGQLKRLCLISTLSACAVLLNPYGWRLVVYPFLIAGQHKLTLATVEEWQSLDFHRFLGRFVFCLVALLFAAKTLRPRTWTLYDAVTLSIALLAGFTYTRFMLLTGIVLCPMFAEYASFLGEDDLRSDKKLLNSVLVVACVLFCVRKIPTTAQINEQADKKYPAGAVAYLRQHPLDGALLNDFNWGGYLIWNLPRQPIFIDTRTDVFEQTGLYQDYFDLISLKRPIESYHSGQLRYALFPAKSITGIALSHYPNWKVEYQDDTSILLHRVY